MTTPSTPIEPDAILTPKPAKKVRASTSANQEKVIKKNKWQKGQSGNPGGRSRAISAAWTALRERLLPTAFDELDKLMRQDKDMEAKKWAIAQVMKASGPAPPRALAEPMTTKDEEITALEASLTAAGVAGDREAALERLRVLKPDVYAVSGGADDDDEPPRKTLNLVGLGKGRPGHTVSDEED